MVGIPQAAEGPIQQGGEQIEIRVLLSHGWHQRKCSTSLMAFEEGLPLGA